MTAARDILGVRVDATSYDDATGRIVRWAGARESRYVCVATVNNVIEACTDRLVTIDELVDLVAQAAGKTVKIRHDTSKPQGVRGRNSDNSKLREVLAWGPRITLEEGLRRTYAWIEAELSKAGRLHEASRTPA
jgi:nucleoside-diphosphate-sugar epimerase